MRPETRQCLVDARAAAEEIRQIGSEGWASDRVRALAIERLVTILGETLQRIRGLEPSILDQVSDSSKIISMRNVVVHGYDALDPARIQDAIDKNIPVLIEELDALLGGAG